MFLFFKCGWVTWIKKCFRKISPVELYKAMKPKPFYKSPGLHDKSLNLGCGCMEAEENNQLDAFWWFRYQERKHSKIIQGSSGKVRKEGRFEGEKQKRRIWDILDLRWLKKKLWMLRWSPDAWELRNIGLRWYSELSFIHSLIHSFRTHLLVTSGTPNPVLGVKGM